MTLFQATHTQQNIQFLPSFTCCSWQDCWKLNFLMHPINFIVGPGIPDEFVCLFVCLFWSLKSSSSCLKFEIWTFWDNFQSICAGRQFSESLTFLYISQIYCIANILYSKYIVQQTASEDRDSFVLQDKKKTCLVFSTVKQKEGMISTHCERLRFPELRDPLLLHCMCRYSLALCTSPLNIKAERINVKRTVYWVLIFMWVISDLYSLTQESHVFYWQP